MRDEEERSLALESMAEKIRTRVQTPRSAYVGADEAFAAARARVQAAREG
ncbi:hypothetical protein [Rhodobacter sp. NSM]